MANQQNPTDPYTQQRAGLIERIREGAGETGVTMSERVLEVMAKVPRERFVPPCDRSAAYDDRALQIGLGQTLSQPTMVAWMTSLLQLEGHENLLEIGTGSGYQAYILACLLPNGRLTTIERHPRLARRAARHLAALGARNARVVIADGSTGYPELAPFDGILVTAGAPDIPMVLVDQLSVGGTLVCPVGPREMQDLITIRRDPDDGLTERHHGKCVFVPLVGEWGWGQ